jgi:putative molybdopterin biosynthesis protein
VVARALRPLAAIERTLLAVGSHDVALDLLAGRLAAFAIDLVSAHVGSIGGLVALRERAAHLAGTHVRDPETGAYNDAAVRRYGPEEPVALVRLAQREQGLLVARGNPLRIASLADVGERGARYVNRQKDAGTRILLDALLARAGIAAERIDGYERLEFSHLAVAQLVQNGSADTGLAIRAAAQAFGLDFVSVAWEPYDLALPVSGLEEARIARLLETLREPAFRAEVEALGGYDCAHAGEVRIVVPEAVRT